MKRQFIYIIIVLFITLGLFWGATPARIKIDGITGEVWDLMLPADTKYANGYSDKTFNQIKIGMTEQEVLEKLGEPLVRWRPFQNTINQNKAHYIGFQYSESPTSTNYRLRQVYLDKDKVAEVIGYFYLD